MAVNSIDAEEDQFAYRYDTQLLIERRDKDLDEDEISDYITDNFEGNSLIIRQNLHKALIIFTLRNCKYNCFYFTWCTL